ncbi:MAG: N-acetylmuramoyl-L-alanine amidase [Candidatus Eisenbacteria bacterium]|nr:N-acetylmuramoyl-L-alanine amidase [Candidatus Eisenbacteria bacterium]
MRRSAALVAVALLAALILAVVAPAPAAPPPRGAPRVDVPDTAPVRRIDGTPYVAVNDLARLLDATKFWKPELRKLALRTGRHAITLTVDDPFVVVDETTLWLGAPVRSLRGELQVPAALADSLPSDSALARLYYDARRDRVIRLPASGRIGTPTLTVANGTTRLTFPADRPDEALVVARSREHLRLRLGGLFTGVLPAPAGLLRDLRPIPSAIGSAFECAIAREAGGFRLVSDAAAHRVVLELTREALPGVEAFAPESAPGPRTVRVIVIDPGHGGDDPGVIAGGAVEKDLALALARLLRTEIESRMNARVVLTRDADRALTAEDRAEVANRARADLVVSLHFDGFPTAQARGATAYCAPATFVADARGDALRGGVSALLPWRDLPVRHAVQSRALAEAVLSALELRGEGPTRLRERMPYAMLGVNAPGMLLECAALTSPADRDRVTQDAGLRELAATIADGIQAWQRNQ